LIGKLFGHKGNINNLAWSPSGNMIQGNRIKNSLQIN